MECNDDMYEFRVAVLSDSRRIHNFFAQTLYLEEPLIAANGLQRVPYWTEGVSYSVIPQGHSIVAYDSNTGNVIGAALNDEPPQNFRNIYTNDISDAKFQIMFEYMDKMSNVRNLAPLAAEIRLLAVNKAWRRRGVAQSIVSASMDVCLQAGFRWLKIYCTSHYSSLLMTKMKWTKLYSLSYKDYVRQFNFDIKIPPEPHTHCQIYVYDLFDHEIVEKK